MALMEFLGFHLTLSSCESLTLQKADVDPPPPQCSLHLHLCFLVSFILKIAW